MKWIELITCFECNCRCLVCSSYSQAGTRMSRDEMRDWLERGRDEGAVGVWFGGGEPTLHPDLVSACESAREFGYRHIRVQTNGMRFAYQPYAERCVAAGVNQVALSIMGKDAAAHDGITRTPGSHKHMLAGLDNLVSMGVSVEADVLISSRSITGLHEIVELLAPRGVENFAFWLFSLHGTDDLNLRELLPRMSELVPHLERALAAADGLGVKASSFHTPPCVLTENFRDRYVHSGNWNLLVVPPGSEPFMAELSPMEGGAYLEGCAGCRLRPDCLGPRADYLDIYGPDEFRPFQK
jgi:MoaA/NifB/PqqE/SkfB family radical SAM enzyme